MRFPAVSLLFPSSFLSLCYLPSLSSCVLEHVFFVSFVFPVSLLPQLSFFLCSRACLFCFLCLSCLFVTSVLLLPVFSSMSFSLLLPFVFPVHLFRPFSIFLCSRACCFFFFPLSFMSFCYVRSPLLCVCFLRLSFFSFFFPVSLLPPFFFFLCLFLEFVFSFGFSFLVWSA